MKKWFLFYFILIFILYFGISDCKIYAIDDINEVYNGCGEQYGSTVINGWKKDENGWIFLDAGIEATNIWVKNLDGDWKYLGENGYVDERKVFRDVDNDGNVDYGDVEYLKDLMVNFDFGMSEFRVEDCVEADINLDNGIDGKDVIRLKKVLALEEKNNSNKYNFFIGDKNCRDLFEDGCYVDPKNGRYFKTEYVENYRLLKEYSVEYNEVFTVNNALSYCFFDSEGNFIQDSGVNLSAQMNTVTIDNINAKYISINFYNDNDYGILRQTCTDYDVVFLGDSTFGFYLPPYDVGTYLQLKTGLSVLNGAFGGTHASIHSVPAYDNFSFYNLADAIYNEDFSSQINTGNSVIGASTWEKYGFNINRLANADFSKVKIITVNYGTNDWSAGNDIDNINDKYDTSTYMGSLRYGIEKINEKYPDIDIVLISPIYRGDIESGSDVTPNGKGVYLFEFAEGMKQIAEEYNLKYIDIYYGLDFNSETIKDYFISDKVHPNLTGVKRIAGVVGGEIMSIYENKFL